MKTLAVIPARLGATRFPGKPLAPLRGRPVLHHVWDAVRTAPGVTRTVIATDSDELARAASAFGAEVMRTRAEHATGSDRVAEVAARLGPAYDAVLNVQGDQPLLSPEVVAEAIRALAIDPETQAATLAALDRDPAAYASPHVVKVVCDLEGRALYFSRAPVGGAADASGRWRFLHHIGLYAFRPQTLASFAAWPPSPLERSERLEQLRLLEHGIKIRVTLTARVSRGVDTPEDLAALERDWDALVAAGPTTNPSEASP
jgi:3-deoxy-manno-octulosonate cytidylyltransferase (CMP-KDO synthetase)